MWDWVWWRSCNRLPTDLLVQCVHGQHRGRRLAAAALAVARRLQRLAVARVEVALLWGWFDWFWLIGLSGGWSVGCM
jgi:hypothetical protein